MNTDTKDELTFRVIRLLVSDRLEKRIAYFDDKNNFERLADPDLEDARCLVRMIKKEVEAHNATIKSKQTLVKNFRYASKWRESKLFEGMASQIKKIEKLIEENPDVDYYQIYMKFNYP